MGLLSIHGIIFTFFIYGYVHTEEIDLIADLIHLPKARAIIQLQETWYNRKPIWYLNLTDNNSRKLFLSTNKTTEILQSFIKNKDFAICAILNQEKDNSGTIFSMTNKQSVRLFEIKVALKKNVIRVIYSPDILFRSSIVEKIEYISSKNPWHSICFEYTSHNKQFSVMVDCHNKVSKKLRFHLPSKKFLITKLNEFNIWIGQRNAEQGNFKGILRQMIFSSNSNFSPVYCASLLQNASKFPMIEMILHHNTTYNIINELILFGVIYRIIFYEYTNWFTDILSSLLIGLSVAISEMFTSHLFLHLQIRIRQY